MRRSATKRCLLNLTEALPPAAENDPAPKNDSKEHSSESDSDSTEVNLAPLSLNDLGTDLLVEIFRRISPLPRPAANPIYAEELFNLPLVCKYFHNVLAAHQPLIWYTLKALGSGHKCFQAQLDWLRPRATSIRLVDLGAVDSRDARLVLSQTPRVRMVQCVLQGIDAKQIQSAVDALGLSRKMESLRLCRNANERDIPPQPEIFITMRHWPMPGILRLLDVWGAKCVTMSIPDLVRMAPRLTKLYLRCSVDDDNPMWPLGQLHSLKVLGLKSYWIQRFDQHPVADPENPDFEALQRFEAMVKREDAAFSFLSRLTALEVLDIRWFTWLHSLNFVGLTALQRLTLAHNSLLANISGGKALTRLSSLACSCCGSQLNLGELFGQPWRTQLTQLHLHDSQANIPRDEPLIVDLASMTQLRYLTLVSYHDPFHIDPYHLSKLQKLTYLTLAGATIEGLHRTTLESLTNLVKLDLKRTGHEKALDGIKPDEVWPELVKLKSLQLSTFEIVTF